MFSAPAEPCVAGDTTVFPGTCLRWEIGEVWLQMKELSWMGRNSVRYVVSSVWKMTARTFKR